MRAMRALNQRQAGFSFVELAVSLVLLGLVANLVLTMYPALKRSTSTAQSVRNVGDVEAGIVGFVFAEGRLPCADTDNDGVENCPATVGKVPYVTLGLAAPIQNASGLDFKYAVYSRADAIAMNDSSLTVARDRFRPSVAQSAPVTVAEKTYSNATVLDFCQALRPALATRTVINPAYAHIADGVRKEHVAYVLVDPGVGDMNLDGSPFDGSNAGGMAFEHPTRQQGLLYDDRVIVGYFDQLWEKLGCSGVMSAAGHAHPNIESTLALYQQQMNDYLAQVSIAKDMSFADNFSAGGGLASAAAGLAGAIGDMSTSVAEAINTAGATVPASIAAGISIGLNTAQVALAIANQVITAQNDQAMGNLKTRLQNFIHNQVDPLLSSVKDNVAHSDERAYSAQ
jgi:type II secretory pathway pseudopilin PulG